MGNPKRMATTANDPDKGRTPDERPDGGEFRERLAKLGGRLDEKLGHRRDDADTGQRGSAMGVAFRIATELIAGVLVGAFIGWQLDTWLGTAPVLLLIFFMLGAAAGILNVIRTARKMQPDASRPGGERQGSEPACDE